MDTQAHIIHRVNVDVDVANMATAKRLHNDMPGFIQQVLLPQIEKLLAQYDTTEHIRISQLEVSINIENETELPAAVISAVIASVRQQLGARILTPAQLLEASEEETLLRLSPEMQQWEIWLHFLQTGQLPWFAATAGIEIWEEKLYALLENQAMISRKHILQALLQEHPQAIQRLLLQYSPAFLKAFTLSFSQIDVTPLLQSLQTWYNERYITKSGTISFTQVQYIFYEQLLTRFVTPGIHEMPVATLSRNVLQKVMLQVSDPKMLAAKEEAIRRESFSSQNNNSLNISSEGILVQNAGLVLLHPFLQYFFQAFELLEGKEFKDLASQTLAVHLLHFLATGNTEAPENELLMEKYLCGFYVHAPIERFVTITESMQAECEQLLNAAIQHWKALKNTSVNGLREAFLQRNGKLITGNQQQLLIEKQTIDILLEHLPWNCSIVTLPWLENILYIDWNIA